MTRVTGLFMGLFILAAVPVLAQETSPGPGTVEVTVVPGGGTFFTAQGRSPSFGLCCTASALTECGDFQALTHGLNANIVVWESGHPF